MDLPNQSEPSPMTMLRSLDFATGATIDKDPDVRVATPSHCHSRPRDVSGTDSQRLRHHNNVIEGNHRNIIRLLLEDDSSSKNNNLEYQSINKEFHSFLSDNKDVLDETTIMKLLER
ncbi:hypothetical protein JHK85_022495 [Glycine max]|nr:hypothetical protein JHK85_022495 [Glycine max]